jgi:hypothetical protein
LYNQYLGLSNNLQINYKSARPERPAGYVARVINKANKPPTMRAIPFLVMVRMFNHVAGGFCFTASTLRALVGIIPIPFERHNSPHLYNQLIGFR